MELARAEAESAFGDGRVYLEKFVLTEPRHVEVQVMADKHGGVVHYGERECSVQRRHQKLVEESPCVRSSRRSCADDGGGRLRLAAAVGYRGAGTVEFMLLGGRVLLPRDEHPPAGGAPDHRGCASASTWCASRSASRRASLVPRQPPEPFGHAIEVRINAEDPDTFFPSLGTITRLTMPGGPGVRMDSALYRGLEVTPHYDSMLGKLIVHAQDREHRDRAHGAGAARAACRRRRDLDTTGPARLGET